MSKPGIVGGSDGSDQSDFDISIVMPCRNGAATLRDALESLVGQRWHRPWQIVLADNGSTDATREVFAAFGAEHPDLHLRIVDASARPGKSSAVNAALSTLRSRAFLFLDDDDAVAPGWLEAMAGAMEERPLVAARLETALLSPEWAHAMCGAKGGIKRLPFPPHCPLAGGSTLGFHRAVFETVGPFDPTFLSAEDSDFLVRAYHKGFRLSQVPEAVYHYRLRATPKGIASQEFGYTRYNARLRRLYDPNVRSIFALRPWLWLVRSLCAAGIHSGLRGIGLRRRGSPMQQARRAWWVARLKAELVGALAEGVAPRAPKPRSARKHLAFAPDSVTSLPPR